LSAAVLAEVVGLTVVVEVVLFFLRVAIAEVLVFLDPVVEEEGASSDLLCGV
jgi:hypothetical protein